MLWLLDAPDFHYVGIRYDRDPDMMLAPAELRYAPPLGKSPVLVDHIVATRGGALL